MLKLVTESLAERNRLRWDIGGRREVRKQEQERQTVIQVSQRIDEGRVALLDNVVESELGGVVLF